MPKRNRLLFQIGVGAACFHLALAAVTMTGFDLQRLGKVGTLLDTYAYLTVSNGTYAFFSPGIGPGMRVTFAITDQNGNTKPLDYLSELNGEASLRLSNQFRLVLNQLEDQRVRKAIVSSWAAFLFGDLPGAQEVAVDLQIYEVPSMNHYRTGQRAIWKTVYHAAFTRNEGTAE